MLPNPSNADACHTVLGELTALRQALLDHADPFTAQLAKTHPNHRHGARNLIHDLALRSMNLAHLDGQLRTLGLASVYGDAQHVLAHTEQLLHIAHRLTQPLATAADTCAPAATVASVPAGEHATLWLGKPPASHAVRMVVTLPAQAALDSDCAQHLVDAGMDIARIDCARDDADHWTQMISHVRQAAAAAHTDIKLTLSLGGPDIRIGPLPHRPPVLKLKPKRDEFGRVFDPTRLHLRPIHSQECWPDVDASVGVWEVWLERLSVGTTIDFVDARGARRHLLVVSRSASGVIAEGLQTAYLTPETVLTVGGTAAKKKHSTLVCQIDSEPTLLVLHVGDTLRLTQDAQLSGLELDEDAPGLAPVAAHITCTVPQVINQVKVGERVWFGDGRLGGVIRQKQDTWVAIEITQARPEGEKLSAHAPISLPDSKLRLAALTENDLTTLRQFGKQVDIVEVGFVQRADDVVTLQTQLTSLGLGEMGFVLNIDTLQGVNNLPAILLAAMASPHVAILVHKDKLAVECGHERLHGLLADVLRCAEAAHLPVLWTNRALKTLASTGALAHAELLDAEAVNPPAGVMLDPGPYLVQAVRAVDDRLKCQGTQGRFHRTMPKPVVSRVRSPGGQTGP